MTNDRAAIRGTLQAGYGDATQTVLDDRVAGAVLSTLRERGWASLDEMALVIMAAGGEIRITHKMQAALRAESVIETYDDGATGDRVLRVVTR